MPFFDQALPPAMPGRPPYEHDVVKPDSRNSASTVCFVTPEITTALSSAENATTGLSEWNRKAPLRKLAAPWARAPSSSSENR